MRHGGQSYSANQGRHNPEIRRIASAKLLPIPLTEVKADLRVDSDDEDQTVFRLARAAALFFEIRTGCVALAGRFEARLWDWPTGDVTEIRRWPLRAIERVQYLRAVSSKPVWTDVDVDKLFADQRASQFVLEWPPGSGTPPTDVYQMAMPIKVIFTAGFDVVQESGAAQSGDEFLEGDVELPIDAGVRNALQALIAHYYENRELFAADKAAEVEASAGSILNAYRQFW